MDVMENDGDSESIYMNVEDAEKISYQSEIYNNILLSTTNQNLGSAGAGERRKVNLSNMAAVCLGFLCVLLLAVITVLCIKHNNEMLQMQSSNDNMTTERDRLQNRYIIINNEKEQLWNQNNKLISERNQLQISYNALRSERDALQNKLTNQVCCPVGWMWFSTSCYLVSSSINTWEQSRQNCRNAGADLVIINSREEQEYVSRLGKNVWIGLTDHLVEGHWKWVDNTPVGTGYWGINEPNNGGQRFSNEDCAQVIVTNPVTSNWNDIHCNNYIHYLCEKRDSVQHSIPSRIH
ncbi:asialoglycoprotein receptor 2-like isoform X1 [Clarias gariepinus]|uniref:asialoglycoprotein receptor 2-like isoform X1 n=1 Tax=Clarias gariepinus TaxID=13013 RepID=UPI00234D62AE|nr:asialoglycoprotein receptor 2-like isoform X1 [Clarias gariepinus]